MLLSAHGQGSWYAGIGTSLRADIQQTNIFRKPVPTIIRLQPLLRYEWHSPLSAVISLGYRQERSRFTERELGSAFGLSFVQTQIHYLNPEMVLGYTLFTDAGAGVMFFSGLGRKIPVWNRSLTVDTSGEATEVLARWPNEFRSTYLLIGVEVPILAEGRWGLTIQPEVSLPLAQPNTAITRYEAGFTLNFRNGSF
ncbi:MAG: hypothetical protein AAF399_16805 [Bacteroidota bacterium]